MHRRFPVAVPAALLWTAVALNAQEWRAGIDPRIEFMSILFRLAGNSEYHQCRIPAYDRAIQNYFAPYREHEAVQVARSLGARLDGPMKLAVYVRDAETLEERIPFDRLALRLYPTWDAASARMFLAAARRFAADSNFQGFVRAQQPLYDATNARLRAFLSEQADPAWFARFFGPQAAATIVIVPGLANGAPSYAARFTDAGGAQEIYAVPGVASVDAGGVPVFDADWRTVMVNELAHVYVSAALAKSTGRLQAPVSQIYAAVAPAMKHQSYNNWQGMLNQSISRAVTIEYAMEHQGTEAMGALVRKENARSFFWTAGLVDLLESYRNGREQYPTFESFMPRVVEFFTAAAPKAREVAGGLQPKVVSTSIANGAQGVDPATTQLVVRFSMPMGRAGPNRSAKLSGGRFDATGTVLTMPVTLEPDREYAIPLRWAGGQAFVSAEGVPLPTTVLRFHTRP